jgi:hypothetical protein
MGSGSREEVAELGPTEDFDWQEAQNADEAEVEEIREGKEKLDEKFSSLPTAFKTQRIDAGVLYAIREFKKPFNLNRVKPRKGHGGETLHYIDARDVMMRLDEVVGPLNWQDSYEEVMGRIICTLRVRFGDEWISKADGAGDTKIEGDKGGISGAFKRAACRWGIGRYLYYFPKGGAFPSWADPDSGKWTNDICDRI